MFPTPWTIEVQDPIDGEDADGNSMPSLAPPRTVAVMGWSSPSPDTEPASPDRQAIVRDLDVYAPPSFSIDPRSVVTILGDTYTVVGHLEDFGHGPFQFAAGKRLSLLRVEEKG